MSFRDFITHQRRLAILRLLEATAGYGANARLIAEALADLGLAASRDAVNADLAWLDEQGLVTRRAGAADDVVATATVRGLDVAAGRAIVPGVARPDPAIK